MSFLADFHFLRPWWLVSLILLLAMGKYFFAGLKNTSAWEAVCDKKLLDFLLIKGSSRQRRFVQYLAVIGIAGAILALSGPTWSKKNIPTYSPSNPVMILLNLSSDMDNTDITPNRLARAKFGIEDLLKKLKAQVGLIVYTDEPYLITPVTDDTKVVANLLPAISRDIMPENGDKLNRAIDLAVEKFKQDGYSNGSIVIFSADIGQDMALALSSAEKAAALGYQINVVGVLASDNEKLFTLASKGGGDYFNVSAGLNRLISELNSRLSSELQKNKNEQETWNDEGYWFLLIPLLCCLYFFRRGIFVLTMFMMMTAEAHAGFFTNSDQDAAQSFAAGNYSDAAAKFSHSDWKAAAFYRNGDYQSAAALYRQKNDVENMYNLGNALAKSGKIEDAIKQYEEVLKLAPEHEDAKFNLEYLKQQQNRSQQSQSQNQNDDDNPRNGEDQNQSDNENNEQDSSQSEQDNSDNQNNDEENKNSDKDQTSPSSSSSNADNNQNDTDSEQSQGQTPQPSSSDENGNPQSSAAEQSVPAGGEPDQKEDEEAEGISAQEKQQQGDFTEEVQAREMSYRNIPENPGGLLKAFIYKEYTKNRYGDN